MSLNPSTSLSEPSLHFSEPPLTSSGPTPPQVVDALSSLVTYCNNYLSRPPPAAPAVYLVQKAAVYITQILKVVGVAEGADDIGFPVSSAGSEAEVEGPLDALTEFRDAVRSIARKKGPVEEILGACDAVADKVQASAPAAARLSDQVAKVLADFAGAIRAAAAGGHGAVLTACDHVRDDALTAIGVRLEDATREGQSSTWKLDDPETLMKEVAARRAEAEERAKQAKAKAAAKLQQEVDKLTAGSADPFETLKPDLQLEGGALSQADVEAWVGMQPPPKAKGKPTPEWLEASRVRQPPARATGPRPTDVCALWAESPRGPPCPGGDGEAGAVSQEAGRQQRGQADGEGHQQAPRLGPEEEGGPRQAVRGVRQQGRRGVPREEEGGAGRHARVKRAAGERTRRGGGVRSSRAPRVSSVCHENGDRE